MFFLLAAMFAKALTASGAMDCSALAAQEADRVIDFRLATVTRANTRLVPSLDPKIASGFAPTFTKIGEPLIVTYPPENGYVLAIIPKNGVLRTGCLSANSIKIRTDNRSSSAAGWTGKWRKYEIKLPDYDTIVMAREGGKIHVTGTSLYFYKPRESDNYDIDAYGLPQGDILEVDGSFEEENSGCTIRIQRIDPYIVVTERTTKEVCSPNNATFTGVYHRLAK